MPSVDTQLHDWMKAQRIEEVEALVPDITGNARGKIVPASEFLKGNDLRLPEAILVQTVTGDWPGDEIWEGILHPTDRDLFLKADPDTARMVPWSPDPTAQVIHDCIDTQGNYHPLSSRNVLRSVLKLFDDRGLVPMVAPEVEFYLVERNTDPDVPLRPPVGRSGRPERARRSYSLDALNEFDPLFEQMYDYSEIMKLDLDTLIHESGVAQMEVNFRHDDALSRADQVFMFKRMMREVAIQHNMYATFLAMPIEGEPGSSMHIHQSLLDKSTGKNVFASEQNDDLNQHLRHYIGGLQKYAPGAMIFLAPYVNSYRRLVYGDSAPRNVSWGIDNRTAGLRVPVSGSEDRRIESRFAGSDVNPYLAIAATLACGYLGIVEEIEPDDPIDFDAADAPQSLPIAFEVSLDTLEGETKLREVLGEPFVTAYISTKRTELETFFRVISSWEREHLLLTV